MSGELLQLTSVAKSFGAVRALKGVSFNLIAGEIHALLGENGAGKSTLIKVITGAYQPDGGTIQIDGQDVGRLSPAIARKLGIACIYQQPALFPDLSVAENIALRLESAAAFSRIDWNSRRRRAQELLQRIGAEISPDAEVRSLSMPEQQLVEIACALGSGARIVIMDEPTASLTQKETHLLFAVVRELRKNGVGIIYISHRLEEIFQLADRVTVLRDGESIGTNRVDEMNEASLIKLMVGRDISAIYPPSEKAPGEIVFSLKSFSCPGAQNISLEIRAGEILGIAGLVGAGRTELARGIFGIAPVESGEMFLDGKKIEIQSPQDAVARGIAYVPEDRRRHGVILEMPIAQNMTMAVHKQFFPGTWLRFGAERQLALGYIRDLSIKAFGPEAPGKA